MEFLENKVVVIAITFLVYWSAKRLQARTGWLFLNPILVSMIAIIALLKASGMPYEKYAEGANSIDFWLKPAIVALAVPLYLHANNHITTCRLCGWSGVGSVGGKMDGGFRLSNNIFGTEIGNHANSNGGYRTAGRHTIAHGSHCYMRGAFRGDIRCADSASGPGEEPDSPGN